MMRMVEEGRKVGSEKREMVGRGRVELEGNRGGRKKKCFLFI